MPLRPAKDVHLGAALIPNFPDQHAALANDAGHLAVSTLFVTTASTETLNGTIWV